MSKYATISSDVLVGLCDAVCAEGVDPLNVSDACHVSRAVWFGGDESVLLSDFVGVLEHVARCTDSFDFGWRAGKNFDLNCLGELGEAILCAPTLGLALKTFSDYLRLVQTTTILDFRIDGDQALITYRILDPDIWPRRQDAEFTLSIFQSLLETCIRDGCRDVSMAFEHGNAMFAGEMLSTPDLQGRPNVMTFPVRCLDVAMGAGDRIRWRERSQRLKLAMVERDRSRPVSARTEAAIFGSFGRYKPNQHRVAAELGFSSRSLHRHLQAEGETFSGILTDCRLRFAKHLLAHRDLPLSEIALELGFEDQSCFSRVFQISTGVSPLSYRRNAIAARAGLKSQCE